MYEGDADPENVGIGRDIWFRFVSDDTVFYKGFNLSYIVRSERRKLLPNGLTAREITYNNFEISLVVCQVSLLIPLHEKFLQFDWLRAVVFQLNLKYLHVKITNLLRVVV